MTDRKRRDAGGNVQDGGGFLEELRAFETAIQHQHQRECLHVPGWSGSRTNVGGKFKDYY